MPSRRCIEPSCGKLFDREDTGTWRCPEHQAATDARRRARAAAGRPSTAARGYGHIYRRRAAAIVAHGVQAAIAGTPQACGICLEPCLEGQQLVAHHPDGKPHLTDQATCVLVLAHAGCNSGYRHTA